MCSYIGLLRADGTEPPEKSGYARAALGEVDIWDIPTIPSQRQIVFPEVRDPGYGVITAYVLFNCPEVDAPPLYIWPLPEPVNVHMGTVPVIHNGPLLLGVDVTANIVIQSAELGGCR